MRLVKKVIKLVKFRFYNEWLDMINMSSDQLIRNICCRFNIRGWFILKNKEIWFMTIASDIYGLLLLLSEKNIKLNSFSNLSVLLIMVLFVFLSVLISKFDSLKKDYLSLYTFLWVVMTILINDSKSSNTPRLIFLMIMTMVIVICFFFHKNRDRTLE